LKLRGQAGKVWWTHTVNNLPKYFLIFSFFNGFAEFVSLKRDGNTKINAKVTKEKP